MEWKQNETWQHHVAANEHATRPSDIDLDQRKKINRTGLFGLTM